MTAVRSRLPGALALLAGLGPLGCRDIERFDTENGEAYCGSMVSAQFLHDGFIPENGRPNLGLRLEIDTDALTTTPGTLTTNDARDGLCPGMRLLDAAELRAIPQVQSDELGLLEFGDGREYNFTAWVESPCVGSLLAVVSLMKSDSVEVRLLKPAPEPGPTTLAAERPGFVVFTLARRRDGCGF